MRSFLRVGMAALWLAAAHPIVASEIDPETATKLKEAGKILPLEKIVEKARRKNPGRVLEAKLEEKGGRLAYEVELVDDDGVVRELIYDAKSGELISEGADD